MIKKSENPPSTSAANLRGLCTLINNHSALRARYEQEIAAALAADGAAAAPAAAAPAAVAQAQLALASADATLAAYHCRARALMGDVHRDAEASAREACGLLKAAFDIVAARTRRRIEELVAEGLFHADTVNQILARTTPVLAAAEFLERHQPGRLSQVFGALGEPELRPDTPPEEVLGYWHRAQACLASAKEHLAAVKGRKD